MWAPFQRNYYNVNIIEIFTALNPCNKKLECGHNCAGVCGEICPSKDFCVECAPENVLNQDINSKTTKFPPHKKAFDVTVSSLYQAKLENEESYASDSSPPVMNILSSISSETFQETLSQLRFSPNESTNDDAEDLQERITEKREDIKKRIENILESQRYKDSEEKFKNNIHARLVNLLENCNEIENCDLNLNNTLSIEEILEIYQAIKTEFKSSRHLYECPNGHLYTIEKCDEVTQTNKCPDCNEQI
ncbi:unnamed protein product [Rhizophagus irregularis]|nr:unnamed protein product [Rhizophagus irregularis]